MRKMMIAAALTLMPLGVSVPTSAIAAGPATVDPAPDRAHPPRPEAFVIPTTDGAMNALLYIAAGAGPHPTLLLLHGFPGNEQNLDLAQAARRDGWNVLTLHYRGSWGSPGAFSFTHAAQDAHIALAFLRDPANVAKYAIDPARIAVAGHSMGGFMAADAAADDPRVIGLFIVDGWNIAATMAAVHTPAGKAAWENEAAGDLPPLAGTSAATLAEEGDTARFDLVRRVVAYGARPLAIAGAAQAEGDANLAALVAARAAGNRQAEGALWPTDHSFSDSRVALAETLVRFLDSLAPR